MGRGDKSHVISSSGNILCLFCAVIICRHPLGHLSHLNFLDFGVRVTVLR